MARAKSNKKTKTTISSGKGNYSFWQLNIIIVFLILQNSYLVYANFDSIEKYLNLDSAAGFSVLMGLKEEPVNGEGGDSRNDLQEGRLLSEKAGTTIEGAASRPLEQPGSATQKKQKGAVKKKGNHPVRVNILNGCRVGGIAASWKKILRKKKYDVRDTGNTKSVSRSTVISRISDMSSAYELADRLGISRKNVIQQLNRNIVDIDVTLIVGKDYTRLKADWK